MNEQEAREILTAVRVHYRAGYGSSDKQYDTGGFLYRLMNPILTKRRQLRNEYKEFAQEYMAHGSDALIEKMDQTWAAGQWQYLRAARAGNALEMAWDVAIAVANSEHKALLLYIGDVHTCCAVDYERDKSSPASLISMDRCDRAEGAWIIDPWLNIACRFLDYHRQAYDKLTRWREMRKQVLYESQWRQPDDRFRRHLELSPLRFEEVHPIGRTTKSARNTHSLDRG